MSWDDATRCDGKEHHNGMTRCEAMGRGRRRCDSKEGGLLHNNQQKDGDRGRAAKGEARNVLVMGIGGEATNFISTKIIIITPSPHITRGS
jgi:hypothetical protein